MEQRQVEVLLEQADVQRRLANWKGAIELLQRALAYDPNHARAHASLALALLGARRVAGAGVEVGLALVFDADDPFCHYAAAEVRIAERKLDDAWSHCLVAIHAASHDADYHVLGARIRHLRGELAEARELLAEALEREPGHTDALVELARIALEARELEAAARHAEEALQGSPTDVDAHVVAGMIDLVRGDDASAENHARFALHQDSTDDGALHLWAAIKARRSPVLGVWWRFHAWVSIRSERGQLGLLIGSFVAVRIAIILAWHFELDALEAFLGYAWLGFCAYTWFAPALFRKLLERDLGTVVLDPDY